MDLLKDKGSHTQRGTKHINKPTTHQERTQENCALFCVYTAREKETTTTPKEPQRQCKRTKKDNQNKADKVKDKKQVKR